jgi:hypothetical protein
MPVRAIAVAVMIAAVLAALIASGSSKPGGSGGGGGGGHHKTSAAPHGGSASNDATIVSCTTTNGQPTAKVKIVNHSSKTSNYIVTVAFDSSDGKVHYVSSLSSSSTSDVAPGGTIVRNTAVSKSSSNSGKFSCKVESVSRWAS